MVGNLKNQDNPRFTLNELKDVLTERNTLKSKLIEIEDELAYYKSKYVCFTLIYITRCYCANDWLYHPYTIPPIHYHPYTIPPIHYTTYTLYHLYTTTHTLYHLYTTVVSVCRETKSDETSWSTEEQAADSASAMCNSYVGDVQGPINREPWEKLHGKQESGIRKL